MAQQLIASITSDPRPQSGQKHRSSGNFSTEGAPSGTHNIQWTIAMSDGSSPDGITFDVMKDVSGGTDPTIWSGVRNGSQTSYSSYRSVYIANPSGASKSFTVLAYAVYG